MAAGVIILVDLCCFRERSSLSPVTRKSAWLASASASRKLSLGSGATGPDRRSRQKREVPKARGEQFGRAGPKSRPEERSAGDIPEFRYERVTGDERERLAFPSVKKLGWRAQRRQKRGEQDVGVEDEAHQDRLARSR